MAVDSRVEQREAVSEEAPAPKRNISMWASAKLAALLLTFVAATVLLGAWCPQESQVGQEKIIEQFGEQTAMNLIHWGITDIFHSPFFLFLIALLTLNITVASFQRVFPKLKLLKIAQPFLEQKNIARQPMTASATLSGNPQTYLTALSGKLRKKGFNVKLQDDKLAGEFGKFSRFAASVTHVGLLSLLAGVTITSWTGFSGFKPVCLDETMSFKDSEHSKLWIGKLPAWSVRIDGTRREDYESGDAKQWYSDLVVVDPASRELTKGTISVNSPLSYEGVDIYQSSWGMDHIVISFNGHEQNLQLRPMGKLYAAFMPLDQETILIFSVKDQTKPLRLFAKRPNWQAPRLLAEVPPGGKVSLGTVEVKYVKAVPLTGLQYKSDPGLPITYIAFAFIICGVMLATVPYRQIWAQVVSEEDGRFKVVIGGRSPKAKTGFARMIEKIIHDSERDFPVQSAPELPDRELALSASAAEPAAPVEDRMPVCMGDK